MIITLVTDQFYQNNHGTSVSAQRLYQGLVEMGHTVRVLAIDDGSNTPFALKERSFGKPIDKVIHSQGMQLAKPDKEIIKRAITGADVVHIFMPFKLGYKTIEMCREMDIPCTAAFHVAPENITTTLHLNKWHFVNSLIWKRWYNTLYQYVRHIHCPSHMIAKQLIAHNFNSENHVVSNGYNDIFKMEREAKPTIYKDKFIVVVNGRLSREKRFDLVINAVNASKYREEILLILGGCGPIKKQLLKLSNKLPNFPVFLGSYNREQQLSFLNFADLYVHPADVEIEGMTCLESIACGCVPIVSDSPQSATTQFVLHQNSIFRQGDYMDLTSKIDWWFEHPDELQAQREIVLKHAQNFTVEHSMTAYMDMFQSAIIEQERTKQCNIKNDNISNGVYSHGEQADSFLIDTKVIAERIYR